MRNPRRSWISTRDHPAPGGRVLTLANLTSGHDEIGCRPALPVSNLLGIVPSFPASEVRTKPGMVHCLVAVSKLRCMPG